MIKKELIENSTSKDFLLVQSEGNRDVKRNTKYYNLDAIIAVGFKVNSKRAIDFRLWTINILKQYSIKGYVLDNPEVFHTKWQKLLLCLSLKNIE